MNVKKLISGSTVNDSTAVANADLDGDGAVNMKDLMALKKMIVN